MRKITLLYFTLLYFSVSSYAQDTMTCGSVFNEATIANAVGARRIGLEQQMPIGFNDIITDFSTTTPYVFNVFFHKIVADDGTTPDLLSPSGQSSPDGIGDGDLIGEEEFLEAIRALNIKYNGFNIFFKYRGFDIIKNSSLMVISYDSSGPVLDPIKNWVRTNNNLETGEPYYQDDAFNLYIVHHIGPPASNTPGLGEYLSTESYYAYKVFQPVGNHIYGTPPGAPYDYINHVVPHEIGHNFMFYHTLNGHFIINSNGSVGDYTEHVTRDITSPDYNADVRSDLVVDTNATPNNNAGVDLNNCSCNNSALVAANLRDWSSWTIDADGNYIATGAYYVDVPYFNIMNAYFLKDDYDTSHCNQARTLSNGQGTRARLQILANPSVFDTKMTIVDSLYEPYKYGSTSINTASSRTLTLPSNLDFTVAGLGNYIAYLQPGFDYEIYACSDATPHYGSAVYTYDRYSEIPHFNIVSKTVKILQLGDNYGPCHFGLQSPHAIQGSLFAQNQGVYTPQQLDSLGINSPNLLLNLPSGTHTINITTDQGETVQKTILVTP